MTPASHPFEIREHDADGVHVVAMLGELDLATAPRLAVRIDAARGAAARGGWWSTSRQPSSATRPGLRALVGCRREVVAGGGRMAVAVLEESAVARLFALAGGHELMPVYDGLEPALAALAP